jgi:phage terminase large subunit-like protein
VTTTPRPIKVIKELLRDPKTVEVRGSSYENRSNLAPSFFERIIHRYEGTRLGRQELHGDILEDAPGALWSRQLLDENRTRKAPEDLDRVVVGVDPQATKAEGHETGIVVSGRANKIGYVLDDLSINGHPEEWGRRVVTAYKQNRADAVIAEVNNGGEMVAANIHAIDPSVNVKTIYASRGKYARAEPIATLYVRKKAKHVGTFPLLEDELCTWEPGMKSPNRLDALVWGLTELLTGPYAEIETTSMPDAIANYQGQLVRGIGQEELKQLRRLSRMR